jgi:hypothetical protein
MFTGTIWLFGGHSAMTSVMQIKAGIVSTTDQALVKREFRRAGDR